MNLFYYESKFKIFFLGGGGGLELVIFFTKNPNLKVGGGWSDFFTMNPNSK